MTFSRISFLFVLLVVLFGCNNPSKKTIFDNLSIEEIKTISKRIQEFPMMYEEIMEIRNSPKLNTQERVDFSELTYEDFIDYHELVNDSTYWGEELQKFEEQWNNEYGLIDKKIDSLIEYYNIKYEKEKLENYVKIEPIQYYPYYKDIDSILIDGYRFEFKLTPIKGKLDKVSFSFNLKPIKPNNRSLENFGLMDEIDVFHFTPFSNVVNVFGFIVDVNNDKWFRVLRDKKIDDLLKNYEIVYEVQSLTFNGIYMFHGDFEPPFEIMRYNKSINEGESSSVIGYRREYISENILKNDDYISLTSYKEKQKDSILGLNQKFQMVQKFQIMKYELKNRGKTLNF